MKERYFSMSPEFVVMMFKDPNAWRVVKNRLPEDAKLSHVDSFIRDRVDDAVYEFHIWVTSAVFSESDPDELPAIHFKSINSD